MVSQDTTLEDIADSITSFGTMVGEQLSVLQQQITELQTGQQELQTNQYHLQMNQRETNQRLDRIEGETMALRNDVKELYQLTAH